MQLSEIWIYPIKSLGGIRLNDVQVQGKGLQYDRRWMVVDDDGLFLTQRANTKMALIDVSLQADGIRMLNRLNGSYAVLPYEPVSSLPMLATVWDDTVDVVTVSDQADQWLSAQLEKSVRVVMMPEHSLRKADPRYAHHGEVVSFADGFPFLLISQGSLDDLNSRLTQAVEIKRFRPNLVVTGTQAYEEDSWNSIQIGHIQFDFVKPCARCILTTIDPLTGEKGPEPLKTLASYRRVDNKVLFGQNLVSRNEGLLCVGEKVVVLNR
jgi:uncharacterized protein